MSKARGPLGDRLADAAHAEDAEAAAGDIMAQRVRSATTKVQRSSRTMRSPQ